MISKEHFDIIAVKLQEMEAFIFDLTNERLNVVLDYTNLSDDDDEENRITNVIITEVCSFFNLNPEIVKSGCRKTEYAKVREYCYYFIKSNTYKSLKRIGRCFSNRDHSTVLKGIQQFESHFETEPIYKQNYFLIQQNINKKIHDNSTTKTNDESPVNQQA